LGESKRNLAKWDLKTFTSCEERIRSGMEYEERVTPEGGSDMRMEKWGFFTKGKSVALWLR
jgi:hypothetical protein